MSAKGKFRLELTSAAKRRKLWLQEKYSDPERCLLPDEPTSFAPVHVEEIEDDDGLKRKVRNQEAADEGSTSELQDRAASAASLHARIQGILASTPPDNVTQSFLWRTIRDAKSALPEGASPDFIPMPLEHQAALEVSLVINLYDNGFSFDEQDVSYQYSRANASVADTVNLGILPGQLDQILQRADRFMKEGSQNQRTEKTEKPEEPPRPEATEAPKDSHEKHDSEQAVKEEKSEPQKPSQSSSSSHPTPITFYEGGIVIEVRDYREGRSTFNPATSSTKPTSFKMFLKPDMHSLLYHLDSLHLTPKARLQIEQNLLTYIHPSVCLDPSFEVHTISTAMFYNMNKFNVPTKTKSARRNRRLVTVRQSVEPVSPLPKPVQYDAAPQPSAVPRSKMPLLSFLQQVHHNSFAQETLQQQQMRSASSEKASSSYSRQVPSEPKPKMALEPVPSLVGKHYFSHFVTTPPQPQQPQAAGAAQQQQQRPQFTTEFITLEIKSSGGPPSELFHATVRPSLTAKPLQVTLGGPSMAQQFFHQFRKLESAATPDQIKYLQTLQQQQQQRAQQQQQQQQQQQNQSQQQQLPPQQQATQPQQHPQPQGVPTPQVPLQAAPGQPPQHGSTALPAGSAAPQSLVHAALQAQRPGAPPGNLSVNFKREGDMGTQQGAAQPPVSAPKQPVVVNMQPGMISQNTGVGRGVPPPTGAPPTSASAKLLQPIKYPAGAPKAGVPPQLSALQVKQPSMMPGAALGGAPKQATLPVPSPQPLNAALFKTVGTAPVATAKLMAAAPPVPVPTPSLVPGTSSLPTAPQTPPSSRPNTRQSSAKKK